MRIAILGATSQIAKDLIESCSNSGHMELHLFARQYEVVLAWLHSRKITNHYQVSNYDDFGKQEFDAIVNFVGVGNPARAVAMGNSIFDVTLLYDSMALNYLDKHKNCQYVFLSSGAVYGTPFEEPAHAGTKAKVPINNLTSQDWYGAAKLFVECRHRLLSNLSIVDIRIFNYFSRTQDISARFLTSDMARAILDGSVLTVSSEIAVRDYIHPADFFRLVLTVLHRPNVNIAIDCYSQSPIEKFALLKSMHEKFGLSYEIAKDPADVHFGVRKSQYFSLNRAAAEFGYEPTKTSLESICEEMAGLLTLHSS
jgi:nucleoside-diphosphate-sugar epimerase